MAVFDPALYDPNAPATSFPGITWTGIDGSVPTSGAEVKSILWAPRVGFAYDLRGTGQTLLRGGYGIFNFHDPQGPYSGFIDLPYGVTFTNATNTRLADVPNVESQRRRRASAAHSCGRTIRCPRPRATASRSSSGCPTRWSSKPATSAARAITS